jgi:DNA-binding GntR family transcriptional regulator
MLQIQSIVDNVRNYLLTQILHGELHPGQQVKEQEIASSLGISRPPIREALKFLEAEGLIVRKPNRGAFVATITEHDAWEIYTLKCSLYEMATRLAFERISEADLETWKGVVSQMETCVTAEPPDVTRYQSLNLKFHDIMFQISGHQRLQKISQTLHHQMNRFSCISLMDKAHLEGSLRYHQEILSAIQRKDMEGTIRITQEHILRGLESVQDIISEEITVPDSEADGTSSKDATGRRAGYVDDMRREAA